MDFRKSLTGLLAAGVLFFSPAKGLCVEWESYGNKGSGKFIEEIDYDKILLKDNGKFGDLTIKLYKDNKFKIMIYDYNNDGLLFDSSDFVIEILEDGEIERHSSGESIDKGGVKTYIFPELSKERKLKLLEYNNLYNKIMKYLEALKQ